jgi:5-methylthioadenosine/S-adenosylhomocysteine deaminase
MKSALSRNPLRACLVALAACGLILAPAAAAPAKLLVKGGTFLTMKPGEEDPFVGYMVIGADGKIAEVGKGEPPVALEAAETLDVAGKIIIPGFISAHSHIWQSAFRGLAPTGYAAVGWSQAVYQTQAVYGSPEDFYWFTLHGALDHLRHGITTAYDFAYGRRAGAFQDEQLLGELDSGLRVVHGWTHPTNATEAEMRAQLKEFLDFAEPYRKSPLLLGFSISGVATPARNVAIEAALTRENGFVNETHYLETPVDVARQQAYFQNFIAANALGPSLYFGHFIHTTDAMLEAVGKAGGGMSWQPLSNGRLASGIADIPKYLKYGIKVGMGVDGQASADLPDPFENMRVGLYLIRAKYENGNVLKPIDVLRFHTMGSATIMHIDDRVGSLEAGKYADFLVINTTKVDRAPVYDPYATLVFACTTENLEGVYVGGELVSSYSKLLKHDFSVAQRELYERVARIRAVNAAAPGPAPLMGLPPGISADPFPAPAAPAGK